MSEDRWVRLADVRVPRQWPLSVFGGLLLAYWKKSRDEARDKQAGDSTGTELGQVVLNRWTETDERDKELLALNRRLNRLTSALVLLTLAVIGVTVWAAVHG